MQNNQNNQNINGFDFSSLPISVTYCGKIIEGKNGWDHFLYSVSIGTGSNMFTTQYKCGLGHSKKVDFHSNPDYWSNKERKYLVPVKPKNSDIVYSLLMDSEAGNYSFQDFCDNFGYSSDSINALNVYRECEKTNKNLRKVFTKEQLQQMQIALDGY